MKKIKSKPKETLVLGLALGVLGSVLLGSPSHAQNAPDPERERDGRERILTIDRFVPHISTVPANAGEQVGLFVRERAQRGDEEEERDDNEQRLRRPVVLMITGSTQPAMAPFDLRFENYSWMAFLARAGFDVFAMDLTGYGLSPRPQMDDACNAAIGEQTTLLIPNPLPAACSPSYPFKLTTSQSDWDEIDTVVDYLRELRHVSKVSLIGWSLGGPRAGGYAARHPDKVKRLLLYAPSYSRLEPSDPPSRRRAPGVRSRKRPPRGQHGGKQARGRPSKSCTRR